MGARAELPCASTFVQRSGADGLNDGWFFYVSGRVSGPRTLPVLKAR